MRDASHTYSPGEEPIFQDSCSCNEGKIGLGLTLRTLSDVGKVSYAELWVVFSNHSGAQLEVCGMSASDLRGYAKILEEGAKFMDNFPWIRLVEEK